VSCSIVECIRLAEAALYRPSDSARQIPFRLRNNTDVYSDQIRVSMESLPVSNLVQLSVDQVRSEAVPGPETEYQEVMFTLPPNPVNSLDRCKISVVSTDEESVVGEEEEARCHHLHRNGLRATRRENEAVTENAEAYLLDADRRNPRVAPRRHAPLTPRNICWYFLTFTE
jgi:hypothetical protein